MVELKNVVEMFIALTNIMQKLLRQLENLLHKTNTKKVGQFNGIKCKKRYLD